MSAPLVHSASIVRRSTKVMWSIKEKILTKNTQIYPKLTDPIVTWKVTPIYLIGCMTQLFQVFLQMLLVTKTHQLTKKKCENDLGSAFCCSWSKTNLQLFFICCIWSRNFKACVHYFSLFLKDKYISSLVWTKYVEKKFKLQLFFLPTVSWTFILSWATMRYLLPWNFLFTKNNCMCNRGNARDAAACPDE